MDQHFSLKKHLILVVVIAFVVGGIAGSFVPYALQNAWGNVSAVLRDTQTGSRNSATSTIKNQSGLMSEGFDEETAVTDLVKKANPAVVSIKISKNISQSNSVEPDIIFPFNGFPFQLQLPRQDNTAQPSADTDQNQLQQIGGGSGFIISSDGLIVTNKHVVSDANAVYTVVGSDGKEYPAKVLARDPVLDVALVKIEATNLSTLSLGNSDQLQIGQSVVAIGYALAEYGNTVTKGVVSGVGRTVEAGDGMGSSEVIEQAIQTDAAINPGNSGGPLLDLKGEVVGINTAVSSQGQLLGFAIPINSLKKSISSVQTTGKIVRPWLGVRYVAITSELVQQNNLPITYGNLIQRGQTTDELAVVPGSPADKAGLVENDIIIAVNGVKLEDQNSLTTEIGTYNVGDEITLTIMRKGKQQDVKVKLEEFPVAATQE